jgi:hypothetical protein
MSTGLGTAKNGAINIVIWRIMIETEIVSVIDK